VADRALLFGGQNPGDAERVLLLSVLNGGYSALQAFVRVPGLTPLDVYRELCRLVGQLALFGRERRPDELPAYDHDNLGYCFDEVIRRIQALLKPVGPRAFEKQYFERAVSPPPRQDAASMAGRSGWVSASRTGQLSAEPGPEYLSARLKDEWVKTVSGKSIYLGVESRLSNEECYRQVKSLEMKLGSATWARESFRQGYPDLELVPVHTFLPQLPSRGVCYFRVRRKGPAWAEVKDSCTMGLQFNWERVRIGPDNRTVTVGRDLGGIDEADRSSVGGADGDGGRVELKFAVYVTEDAES
jgi:type VI secretion system protein ImpJ